MQRKYVWGLILFSTVVVALTVFLNLKKAFQIEKLNELRQSNVHHQVGGNPYNSAGVRYAKIGDLVWEIEGEAEAKVYYEKAIASWGASLEFEPKNYSSRINRAQLNYRLGNYKEALLDFEFLAEEYGRNSFWQVTKKEDIEEIKGMIEEIKISTAE